MVWNPRTSRDDRETRARAARRSGLVRLAIALGAAGVLHAVDRTVPAMVVLGLGALSLGVALGSPLVVHAAIDHGVARVGRAVGVVVAFVLLAPLYYVVLTPFGLLTRRGRRDPLARRVDPEARTYWKERTRPVRLDRPY